MRNTKSENFSIKKRFASFKYAFDGLKVLLKNEHNARLHLFFAVLAIVLGLVLKNSFLEWCIIVFCIGFVFIAEIFNTCIEEICDFVCPEENLRIKKIKDLSALAVLISAITAVIAGLFVFLPKLF